MKLMISYKSINKMMLNVTTYDEIVKFVHQNFFLKMSKWVMYYIDSDGDAISIDSQLDITTMLETCDKEQVKIYVKDAEDQSKLVAQQIVLEEDTTEIKKIQSDVTQEKVIVQEPVQQPKKAEPEKQQPKNEQNQFDPCGWKNHWGDKGMWKKKIQEKMAKFVDERVQSLIPLITKKVEEKLKKSQENSEKQVKPNGINHKVKCNQCGVDQIVGIRYKCVKCPLFNICEACQVKTSHAHNMIKMKYLEEIQDQKSYHNHWRQKMKPQCQFGQINPFGPVPSPFPFPPPPPHHFGMPMPQPFKPPSHPVAGFLIPKKQEQKEKCHDGRLKITKKCFKMSQLFGGEPKAYEQFVTANQDLKFDELSELYLIKTDGAKISQQFSQKAVQKASKLGFYFKKPAEQFSDLVKKYPGSNISQLIKLYKQPKNGKIQEPKTQQKQPQIPLGKIEPKVEKVQQKTEVKVDPKMMQPQKLPPPVIPIPVVFPGTIPKKDNKLNVQKRNDCILQLKELFGDYDVYKYIQFYDKHQEKQNETIIQLYIEHISKK